MIKDFEEYERLESVTVGSKFTPAVKWVKRYPSGLTGEMFIESLGLTRATVREAFDAQESGFSGWVFWRENSKGRW